MSEKIIAESYIESIEKEHAGLAAIKDPSMKKAVKTVMENTAKYLNEEVTTTDSMAQYTPVISPSFAAPFPLSLALR